MTAAGDFLLKWLPIIATGDERDVRQAVAEARELGFYANQNVGQPQEFFNDTAHGTERTCEWLIGALINIHNKAGWHAMNSWVNVTMARLEERGLLALPTPPVSTCTFRWDTKEDNDHATWHHACHLDAGHDVAHSCRDCGAKKEIVKPTPRNGVTLECGCWHYGQPGDWAGHSKQVCYHGHGLQLVVACNIDEPINV